MKGDDQMNMDQVLKQAQKMQSEFARIQEELGKEKVEGVSGGGMVRVTATGQGDIISIVIEPEVIDASEKEILEDLLLAAIHDASRKSRELAQSRLGRFSGAMGLPGLG
jgi:DNA-binding YbaB/EbfC family protein